MSNKNTGVLEPEASPQAQVDAVERERRAGITRTDQQEAAEQEEARQSQNEQQDTPADTLPPQKEDDGEEGQKPSLTDKVDDVKDKVDDAKDVKGRFDKTKANQGSNNSNLSKPQDALKNQGHFPGNKPGQAANTASKPQQVGPNTGHAGPTAGKTEAQKGTGPSFQQAGKNAGNSGTKTAGQTATKAGAEQAGKKATEKGAKLAGKAADTATDDQEAKLAGKAAGKATGAGVGAATGDKELGRKVGEGVEDTAKGTVAGTEAVLSGGGDVEADKELAKLAWKYKGVVLKAWLIVGVFVFAFFFILFSYQEEGWADPANETSPLTITQNGPTTASNGNLLSYTVTVSYPNPFGDIKLTNRIPAGTQFVSSSNKVICDNGDCNESSRVITWSAKENGITTNPVNASFSLRLRATNVPSNTKLPNIINGMVIPLPTPTPTPTTPPPASEETGTGTETETGTETTPE